MSTIRIHALLRGQPRTMGTDGAVDAMSRTWTSAIFKEPTSAPVVLRRNGLDGDAQADLRVHGGPEKAVLVYPRIHYAAWHALYPLLRMEPGAFGENFCVDGATEHDVCVGDVFRAGEARVQVSQPRMPCWKLARRWGVKELARVAQAEVRVGWYLRVLDEGVVQAGDVLALEHRPYPQWSVHRAHAIMHHHKHDLDGARDLIACEALAPSWTKMLQKRLDGEPAGNPEDRLVGPNA